MSRRQQSTPQHARSFVVGAPLLSSFLEEESPDEKPLKLKIQLRILNVDVKSCCEGYFDCEEPPVEFRMGGAPE
jgi:hypothetical protein